MKARAFSNACVTSSRSSRTGSLGVKISEGATLRGQLPQVQHADRNSISQIECKEAVLDTGKSKYTVIMSGISQTSAAQASSQASLRFCLRADLTSKLRR